VSCIASARDTEIDSLETLGEQPPAVVVSARGSELLRDWNRPGRGAGAGPAAGSTHQARPRVSLELWLADADSSATGCVLRPRRHTKMPGPHTGWTSLVRDGAGVPRPDVPADCLCDHLTFICRTSSLRVVEWGPHVLWRSRRSCNMLLVLKRFPSARGRATVARWFRFSSARCRPKCICPGRPIHQQQQQQQQQRAAELSLRRRRLWPRCCAPAHRPSHRAGRRRAAPVRRRH
jgi:hypothetical protein